MILGGVIAIFFAVDAEGKSLEDVATPLSVIANRRRPSSAPASIARASTRPRRNREA